MSTPLSRLVTLLDVEEIEVDLYRGANTDAGWMRVYGGQVVAQALATSTVLASSPAQILELDDDWFRVGCFEPGYLPEDPIRD